MRKSILTLVLTITLLSFSGAALAAGDAYTGCSGSTCLQNPLGNITSPQALIGKIINSVMGIVGSIALLMFVYGGFVWMTSRGNSESIKQGRGIIIWSAVGLFVIFMSYALTRFVLSTIAQ